MYNRYSELTRVKRAFAVRPVDSGLISFLSISIRTIAFLMRHHEFRLVTRVITNAPTSVLVVVRGGAACRENLPRWYPGNWRGQGNAGYGAILFDQTLAASYPAVPSPESRNAHGRVG